MATMKEITYAQAINDAMCEEMQRDENVFMMGEDIAEYCGAFGVSRGMLEKFGKDRIMNTPSPSRPTSVPASAPPWRACVPLWS